MRNLVMKLALFGAAALIGNALVAEEPKKAARDLTHEDIAKLMKDIHRGSKSPYALTSAELKKDKPDWDLLAKETRSFAEMGAAFKRAPLGYTSPAKYIRSAEALTKATAEKDKMAATTAFTGLTQSCGSCHYGGVKVMLKE